MPQASKTPAKVVYKLLTVRGTPLYTSPVFTTLKACVEELNRMLTWQTATNYAKAYRELRQAGAFPFVCEVGPCKLICPAGPCIALVVSAQGHEVPAKVRATGYVLAGSEDTTDEPASLATLGQIARNINASSTAARPAPAHAAPLFEAAPRPWQVEPRPQQTPTPDTAELYSILDEFQNSPLPLWAQREARHIAHEFARDASELFSAAHQQVGAARIASFGKRASAHQNRAATAK